MRPWIWRGQLLLAHFPPECAPASVGNNSSLPPSPWIRPLFSRGATPTCRPPPWIRPWFWRGATPPCPWIRPWFWRGLTPPCPPPHFYWPASALNAPLNLEGATPNCPLPPWMRPCFWREQLLLAPIPLNTPLILRGGGNSSLPPSPWIHPWLQGSDSYRLWWEQGNFSFQQVNINLVLCVRDIFYIIIYYTKNFLSSIFHTMVLILHRW